jgi:hypothetical protein
VLFLRQLDTPSKALGLQQCSQQQQCHMKTLLLQQQCAMQCSLAAC